MVGGAWCLVFLVHGCSVHGSQFTVFRFTVHGWIVDSRMDELKI
jgi:hypothetical protein